METAWRTKSSKAAGKKQGKKGLRKIPQANQVRELTTGCHCPDGKLIGKWKRNIFTRVASLF